MYDDDYELKEHLVTLFGPGPEPVTADEAMDRVTDGHRLQSPKWSPRMSPPQRRVAWAWLSLIVILVVVLVVAVKVASGPSNTRPAGAVAEQVDLAATPKGWVPIPYGNGQISVPAGSYVNDTLKPPICGSPIGGLVIFGDEPLTLTTGPGGCLFGGTIVELGSGTGIPHAYKSTVNGLTVFWGSKDHTELVVPSLGFGVRGNGSLAQRILDTVTASPRDVALAPGSRPNVPASWRTVSYGGLSLDVPSTWDTTRYATVTTCGIGAMLNLVFSPPESVNLNAGEINTLETDCATPETPARARPPTDGVEIDPGQWSPLTSNPPVGSCMSIKGLSVCPTATDIYGVLVLAVHLPGHGRPVAVEIGLAGSGQVARSVLYSIRAAGTSPPPMTTTRTTGAIPGYEVETLSFVDPHHGFGEVPTASGNDTVVVPEIVSTNNGGVTWKRVSNPAMPFESNLQFVNLSDGYAWVGGGNLLRTTDGGIHWSYSLSNVSDVSVLGSDLWAITCPSNTATNPCSPQLETSSDGGLDWHSTKEKPPLSDPSSVSRVSVRDAYLLQCNSKNQAAIAHTGDGGDTWQLEAAPTGCGAGNSDFVAASDSDLWLMYFSVPGTDQSAKWCYRSTDAGTHWTLVASATIPGQPRSVGSIPLHGDFGPLVTEPGAPDDAWLGFDRNGLYETADGGVDWRPAFSDPEGDAFGPPSVSFIDASDGWVSVYNEGLWRTTDGTDWSEISFTHGLAP